MRPLTCNAASTYRRVNLDARIEAASGADLTRICLEEAVGAMGQALMALERKPDSIPREPLARAQSIVLWLARGVDPANPLASALTQFYGGTAKAIGANIVNPSPESMSQLRGDFEDLLGAL